ncbi:uncharacterized protein TM35_000231210 [Trypanosoma theileri]|uniref:RanBP2-type domain-containing protein n=1 Tax=Trypanosoma theileri TaxID=67003 RepID=A0A1X0NSR1_9TRYP|nr:uncharacterized protein TM35_000231210 [Trypanosoma theileri]ORC87150.1 hypothetical protein TM35_000231210 [Trypanosoma theileri]
MLKRPYVRKRLIGSAHRAVPLEYSSGVPHGASLMFSELQRLGKHRGSLSSSTPPSLAFWIYRSSLLRQLWREGIVCEAIVSSKINAQSFTALLHSILSSPSLQGDGGAPHEEAIELVRNIQREFILSVLSAAVENQQWPWTLQEVWECTTTLVGDCISPDDIMNIALLLPLARRLKEEEEQKQKGNHTLRKSLHQLQTQKFHAGILWLLAWRAVAVPRPEPELLEAATTAVCTATTSSFLNISESKYNSEDETQVSLLLQSVSMNKVVKQNSCFTPFWRLLLYEMIHYAHYVLSKKSIKERVRVGALLSLRRIISSFRRHSRVRPVLELHSAIIAPWQTKPDEDPSTIKAPCGPLVYREVLLLDAYTLMTLGHIGESAVDVDDETVQFTSEIQTRCMSHLNILSQTTPMTGEDRDSIGLHRGARAGIEKRLHEGLRLSFKILLRRGANEAVHQLLIRCPPLASSWEGGKALVMLGKYAEAVTVFTQFLESTRQHFSAGLPYYIRCMMLEAVEGAARKCFSEPTNIVERLFHLYEITRTWSFPVPAAVVFAAIVRGINKNEEVEDKNMTRRESLEVLDALIQRRAAVAVCARDGLLMETVEIYIKKFVECCNEIKSLNLDMLTFLQRKHPELPIYRVALLQFIRIDYKDGVTMMLQHIIPAVTSVTLSLAPLQELPLDALESLKHHVEQTSCNKKLLIPAISSALEYRRFAEEERLPWKCYLCQHWNKKQSNTCKQCGSLEIAVLRCHSCKGFSPTNSSICLVCGAETQQPIGEKGELHVRDDCTVYPLRKWRCNRCNHTNEAEHLFYCSKCGSVQPMMEQALTETAYDCNTCKRHNPLGLLRPWCTTCGTLSVIASKGLRKKTLWRCVECGTLSPWLLTHCHGCGGSKPPPTTRLDIPWFTRDCSCCNVTNPAWSVVCHGCGAKLILHDTIKEGENDPNDVDTRPSPIYTSCPHCGTLYPNDKEVVCSKCFAHRPHIPCSLWVCLKNNCLGVNLESRADLGLLVCKYCGVTHNMAAVGGYQSNPLRYREPLSMAREKCNGNLETTDEGASEEKVLAITTVDEDKMKQLPTALLLPLLPGPRVCSSCGVFLQIQNIAHICEACNHCAYSSSFSNTPCGAEQDVALRLILKAMLNTVSRLAQGELSHTKGLSLLRSMTDTLLLAQEAQLPWRGCDLSKEIRYGMQDRVPILENKHVHSAVLDVEEILRTICTITSLVTLDVYVESGELKEMKTTTWMIRRPWVSIALDLVDLINRTTDCDELGFDTLAQICMLIRPEQYDHIHNETRMDYLRHMKLPRECFVNDVLCPICLLPPRHTQKTAVGYICRCPQK